jgi:hypothetical protein
VPVASYQLSNGSSPPGFSGHLCPLLPLGLGQGGRFGDCDAVLFEKVDQELRVLGPGRHIRPQRSIALAKRILVAVGRLVVQELPDARGGVLNVV